MNLSEHIRNYRSEHKLSLRTFAQQCGCSYQYVDKLEKGQIEKPSAEMLKKISDVMGLSIQKLLSETDQSVSEEASVLPDHFDTPEQALLWLADLPVLSFYGGNDIQKMKPEAQLEFAREVLEYMKYLSGRKKVSHDGQ